MKNNFVSYVVWAVIAILGAAGFATLALSNGEQISAAWLIVAAVCTYAFGYRFYSRFIARKIYELDDSRATPAQIHNDSKDYVPTNKYVLFGHHFAAIAGAGPLVGPILAAQMGYLPSILWIIIGAVLAGCVQDFVTLIGSMRRDGKSLGQMAKDEVGRFGGTLASLATLAILVIIVAVLGLVVVKALAESPWGMFTITMTMPIAVFMGFYMRYIRPGKVIEGSVIGFVLLMITLFAGQYVAENAALASMFTFTAPQIAIMMVVYGLIASVLPVWVLLAPRDYLSSFLKIGVIILLAGGILILLPELKMPAVTRFIDGSGPVFTGDVFPFLFITIACGAVSGFHALISSGTTPKLIERESHAPFIGYAGMAAESMVAVMALIAACALEPGIYFAMNSSPAVIGADAAAAAAKISSWGFTVTADQITITAKEIGEKTILSRTGGAPTLAVGMAEIFSAFLSGAKAFWYHFAILFEAVFILTAVDAGTRVGRFMLQDLVGNFYKPFAQTQDVKYNFIASLLVCSAWGYFLYQGAVDPFGGINSLWALFGIANQMLAAIALAVATTIIIKMGKARYAWVGIIPFAFLAVTTLTAGFQKAFSPDPSIGFFAAAGKYQAGIDQGQVIAPAKNMDVMQQIVTNNYVDAILTVIFGIVVILMIIDSLRVWYTIIIQKRPIALKESPVVKSGFGA
ncbi:carbon starvation CstA family protein [Paenibacillus xerothermodurans]|uniref:Carbon starvation protein A n=1 Tax=Paenibacillus xerothermodurans TaxID=1977292 RepID=A0A2W1P6W2_PAEXE|nr:carbon starvation CstA family protein [Paenibacillus xerothermodurans]PZE22798.1 carbon starvation protein A [Paenibacillus xerothermodurans]